MTNNKKDILVLVDWYLPGYRAGGPIRSVANIVEKLGDDFNFHVVTSVYDYGSTEPYRGVTTDQWIKVGKANVKYLAASPNVEDIKALVDRKNYDAIYMNSLFSKHYTLLPLKALGKDFKGQMIVAPRGMLGEGALKIKPFKKKAFLKLAKMTSKFKNVKWHASTDQEKAEIEKHIGSTSEVHVAANIAILPEVDLKDKAEKIQNELNLVFVSRISEKKNLLLAIEALGKVSDQHQIKYTVIGPVEDQGYWEKCEEAITTLPSHIQVVHAGEVTHDQIKDILTKHDGFFLPTQHENYGHVIVEALAFGCPVVVSDQTPWRGLKELGIGIDLPLSDVDGMVAEIEEMSAMDEKTFAAMRVKAVAHARSKMEDGALLDLNRELFDN